MSTIDTVTKAPQGESPQGMESLKNLVIDNAVEASGEAGTETEGVVVRSSEPELREKKIDALGRAYGTGKRKSAVARVWVKPGRGAITINGKLAGEYLASAVREMIIAQPLVTTGTEGSFDVVCTVKGGGLSGQAGAIRHGIARALQAYDPAWRGMMKPLGLLTRDARRVERKKFGRAKARRSFQFSKR